MQKLNAHTVGQSCPGPLPEALQAGIERKKQLDEEYQKETARTVYIGGKPHEIVSVRLVPKEEKKAFCFLHEREFKWKPMAATKRYPTEIDFDTIAERVGMLFDELKAIVARKQHSKFRSLALADYDKLGASRAKSANAALHLLPKANCKSRLSKQRYYMQWLANSQL